MQTTEIVAEIQKNHAEMKSYIDREITEIKKSGVAAPETKDALDRINSRMDELQAKLAKPTFDAGDEGKTRPEESKRFNDFLRKAGNHGKEVELKAMSVNSDPDGGYFVVPETVGNLAKKVYETTPMRQIASVTSISTDALEGFADIDEVDAGWVGETQTRPQTNTPQIAGVRIDTHEIFAQPAVTQKLLDDAYYNVEGWLTEKVADKFARVQNHSFIHGDGVKQPRGIANYPTAATSDGTRPWGTIEHVNTGVNGDFAASNPGDKILDLIYSLKSAYRQGSTFVMPREVIAKIRKFKDQQNGYLWQPALIAGQPSTLLGYPVIEAQDMPTLGTGSLSMAFGNYKIAYLIVDRAGNRVLRDVYTAKPYVLFYTTARVGGGLINSEAIKFMRFGS